MQNFQIIEHKVKSDQELVIAIRHSNAEAEKAFTEFYGRYAQRTYAFILRMTGDAQVSEDLLQEAFLKFHLAAAEDLVIVSPPGFLLRIARNLYLNWKRDETPALRIEDFELTTRERDIEQDELLDLINLSLELLEPEQREAFVLKYYQGYSYEEMMSLTSQTIPTLKNRVWRAKCQIKRSLRSYILEAQYGE